MKAATDTPGVDTRYRELWRDTSNPVEHSQAWKQENAQSAESWEQAKCTSSNLTCVRKLTRTVDTKEAKMEFRNMKITNYQYLTTVFELQQQKLGVQMVYATFGIETTKTNFL